MSALSFNQGLYISLSTLGTLIVLSLLWLAFYRNFFKKRHLKGIVGRKLYHYADVNDYLLLNNYHIHIDDKHIGEIDHILITNKFIIVIHDFSISGVITGEYNDEQLKITEKKGERLIANPLNYNRNLTKRVALFNNLDNSFLKGIVVVNDDSYINIDSIPAQFKICPKKDVLKVIKEFDKEEVKPFKEDTIVDFINALNKNNIDGDEK